MQSELRQTVAEEGRAGTGKAGLGAAGIPSSQGFCMGGTALEFVIMFPGLIKPRSDLNCPF